VADTVLPSTTMDLVIKMSEKHKPTSASASQVKNQWKTIGTEEKLDVISWLVKGEWNVHMRHNATFTHSSMWTTHDNADKITESAKSGTKVNV
jgi:hypothetical protein